MSIYECNRSQQLKQYLHKYYGSEFFFRISCKKQKQEKQMFQQIHLFLSFYSLYLLFLLLFSISAIYINYTLLINTNDGLQ